MGGQIRVVSGAVEGIVDEAVFRRLVRSVGAEPGPVWGKTGKPALLDRLRSYNHAARFSPWLVLVDLDHAADCAPPFRTTVLPDPAPAMCFRVAVRAVEAWLLADRDRFAAFLCVEPTRLPENPDRHPNPKQHVVNLARRSRSHEIVEDLVPRESSGRTEGRAYASRLMEFVSDDKRGWRPHVAARSSDSLARCLRSLRRVIRSAAQGATR
jgi:hypothetical protein